MSTFQKYRIQGIFLGLLMPSLVVAALELPHTFKSGEVISASAMNENFEALREKIEALEGEVEALRASAPAMELRVSKVEEAEALTLEQQSGRASGQWPPVSMGTRQEVPSPGLYQIDFDFTASHPGTANPLRNEVVVYFGESTFRVGATRWSADASHPVHHLNTAFVRIGTPADQTLAFSLAEGTLINAGRVYIRRIGD